jgi:hypothetical protein
LDCTIPPTPFDCPFELVPGTSPAMSGASSLDALDVEVTVGALIFKFARGWLRGAGSAAAGAGEVVGAEFASVAEGAGATWTVAP